MKNRFTRVLMLILVLSVALAAVLVIVASADESDGGTEGSNTETTYVPQIVSKNLSYAEYLYMYFAVPYSNMPAGATLKLNLYSVVPTEGVEPVHTATSFEIQTIKSIGADPADLYCVFVSQGIPAHAMGDYIYAQPVLTNGEAVTTGAVEKYSVAEYLYDRLYTHDFISKTEADKEDFDRKELYISLLEYGAAAQIHFAEKGTTPTPVTELVYYNFKEARVSDNSGFATAGETATIAHDGTAHPHANHVGWTVISYDADNNKTETVYSETTIEITYAAKATIVVPKFDYTSFEDKLAAQVEADEKMMAAKWAEFERKAGKEMADAFKQLYTLFGDEIVGWYANLYSRGFNDPDNGVYAGGYYATTSAKGAEGYGPDVEATDQALRFIAQSGMVQHLGVTSVDDLGKEGVLPDWMKQEIVYFVMSLQDPDDRYFYHPQWTYSGDDDRRLGRDLEWANSILKRFGHVAPYGKPTDKNPQTKITPEAYLKSLGYESAAEANSEITSGASVMSLRATARGAVSYVLLATSTTETETSVTSITEAIESHANLASYLESQILLDKNPWTYGDALNSVYAQIGSASAAKGKYESPNGTATEDKPWYEGMTFKDMTIAYITKYLDEETGLIDDGWRDVSGRKGNEFANTNGLLKTIPIFNNWGYEYPNIDKAVASVMGALSRETPETTTYITDYYNLWSSLNGLKTNVADCYKDDAAKQLEIYTYIADVFKKHGARAITNTYNELAQYKRADGGFNNSKSISSNAGVGGDYPRALGGVDESYCDSVNIAMSTVRAMFSALGYSPLQFYTASDWMRYEQILNSATVVPK